ncbi:g1736 [Coccomyxa elongata]
MRFLEGRSLLRGSSVQKLSSRLTPRAVRQMSSAQASTSGSPKRALISVSDKTGLVELAKGLSELGYDIVSTGGSASAIEAAGVPVQRVEELTGFPEMLDGRVKTLHPGVHGGILARRDLPEHLDAVGKHNISLIDVVVVNLYPFRQTVTAAEAPSYETAVENIDIGGPAMIRAAAKNHEHVTVVVNPSDYQELLEGLKSSGGTSLDARKKLAWKAYQHTATYDSTVAEWFWTQIGGGEPAPELSVPLRRVSGLRYGENPHQAAAFYTDLSLAEVGRGGIAGAIQHHGKEMSYNNYLDGDAAYSAVSDIPGPACVVVKHTNPCGAATRDDLLDAYRLAVRADPISAFGGIVAFNRTVDEALAAEIREFRSPTDGETRMFYEIVIAPGYTPEGLQKLKGKSKTLRILEAPLRAPSGRSLRQVAGGWLYQEADSLAPEEIDFTAVSETKPTEQQLEDLRFAWRIVKHVKSNAITVAKEGRLLGMGSGQPNRVKSTEIALEKAAEDVKGSVLASDAFFPFSWNDSVEKACQAGVAAIAHPGGSLRDQDTIDCCNKYGVALVTTGVRHFRH